MTFDEDEDEYVLSSGRRFYAFGDVLGVSRDGLGLTYGSDGDVQGEPNGRVRGGGNPLRDASPFTPEERQEIAEHMIDRWRRWAALKGEP